jgi:phosphoglycerol transferase MdoB-like AlkP superfamily enzyme
MIKNALLNGQKKNITPFVFLGIGLFFILLGYSFTRLYFFVANFGHFSSEPLINMLLAMWHGVRFDLSAIALLNAPLLLFLFVSIWFRVLFKANMVLVFCYLFVVNALAVVINFVDTIYFPYTGRRSGMEVFSMANDVVSQLPELIVVYWGYAVASALILIASYWFFLQIKSRCPLVFSNKFFALLLCFTLFIVFVVAIRGGFQSKPIRALNAYSYPSSSLGAVVLNTPFALLKEDADHLDRAAYFSSYDDIKASLRPEMRREEVVAINNHNVVILILESFGLEYFGPPYGMHSYVPFLEELSKKSRFFPNGIANGRRSIEAVPSILVGIPSLMSEAFMRSPYQSNTVHGLGQIVKPYGYSTAFFHGAKNGSMYFDETTYRFGFDRYFGLNEYPDSSDFDGQWGIFDEPFLQFTINEIDKMPKPFMAGIFTISSHPPYTLPEQYKDRIKEGAIPMHSVIQYSDIALKRFFEEASKQEWYKDTLFVITADHTSDNFDSRFATSLGRHQIPIILYQPNQEIDSGIVTDIAQQTDIPATIIDYLNLPENDKILPFGRSLLKNDVRSDAIIKEDDSYWLLSQGKYVKLSTRESEMIETGDLPVTFVQPADKQESVNLDKLEKRLKAYVQIYTNGLIDNSLYDFSSNNTQ